MATASAGVEVELALGQSPFATSPTWTDVSASVRSVTVSAGRSVPYGPMSPSTASIVLDNSSRTWDPLIVAGVRPNIPVRVSILTNAGATRNRLFYGSLDAATAAYGFPDDSMLTLAATDGLKMVARETRLGLGAVPEELTNVRFGRVLDAVGWPTGAWRSVPSGSTAGAATMAADTWDDIDAISALTACVNAEGPIGSTFYVSPDVAMVFTTRHSLSTNGVSSTVQASFSNIGADVAGSTFIPFTAPAAGVSGAGMWNKATVTGADGISASATDATSVTNTGPLRFPALTHSAVSSSQAAVDAQVLVDVFGTATPSVTSITSSHVTDSAKLTTLTALQSMHRVRVKFQPPGGGAVDDQEYIVQSITDSMDASGRFSRQLGLWPAAAWDALGGSSWLVVGVGKVGINTVGI